MISNVVLGFLDQLQIFLQLYLIVLQELLTAVPIDITKVFDKVCHAGIFHKLKSYGISGQIFGLISSFLSNN